MPIERGSLPEKFKEIQLKKTKEAPKSLSQRYKEIQENIEKINKRKQSIKKPEKQPK